MVFLLVGSRQLSDKGRQTTKKQAEDGMAEQPRANFDAERMLAHYRTMSRIRAFEETAEAALQAGEIKGAIHLSIGQEAIASGVCANLARTDLIASNHRGHGHTLAKGASSAAMMAELFGRETGTCHGKGGSMHIADFDIGMLGANGVVGAGILIAVGAAQGIGLRGENRVVACFFGDGAINRGPFLEGSTGPRSILCRCCSCARTTALPPPRARPACRRAQARMRAHRALAFRPRWSTATTSAPLTPPRAS
jgi:TPP-dependent pyruvate/acetoin dehydrogenase alpha subunit